MAAGRGRRTGLILIVVIILLLLVGVVGLLFILPALTPAAPTGGGGGAQPTQAITVTRILVATRNIPRGARLSVQDVAAQEWPDSILPVPAGALLAGSEEPPNLEQVSNRIARTDILQGQPVLEPMLTPSDKPTDLASIGSDAALQIPAGQVAVAVPMNRLSSVAYALRPGDHVDVMMSFRFVDVDEDFQTRLPNDIGSVVLPTGTTVFGPLGEENTIGDIAGREEKGPFGSTLFMIPSEDSQRPRQTTQLVLKNVVVMHLGDWPLSDTPVVEVTAAPAETQAPSGDQTAAEPTPAPPPVPDVVTLIMSRQDALVLKYAFEVGADIDFALRSVLDNNVTDVTTDSVTLQYILDFYNVAQPPKLPISFDPRLDALTAADGQFTQQNPAPVP